MNRFGMMINDFLNSNSHSNLYDVQCTRIFKIRRWCWNNIIWKFLLQYASAQMDACQFHRTEFIIIVIYAIVLPIARTLMETWSWHGSKTRKWIWIFWSIFARSPDMFSSPMWASRMSFCHGKYKLFLLKIRCKSYCIQFENPNIYADLFLLSVVWKLFVVEHCSN